MGSGYGETGAARTRRFEQLFGPGPSTATMETSKLVMLRKAGRQEDQPSAYRPIVLLDEICKILERILATRLVQHLERVGPNLSGNQYGFRSGRSTTGAVARLREIAEEEPRQDPPGCDYPGDGGGGAGRAQDTGPGPDGGAREIRGPLLSRAEELSTAWIGCGGWRDQDRHFTIFDVSWSRHRRQVVVPRPLPPSIHEGDEGGRSPGLSSPNLGGPSLRCRKLYMGVVRSITMYGAPIWVEHLAPENRLVIRKLQRVMATRAVRGYRTISKDAACLLAGTVPWDIDARSLADVYWRCAKVRTEGGNTLPEALRRMRDLAKDWTIDSWADQLRQPRVSVALNKNVYNVNKKKRYKHKRRLPKSSEIRR
nr:uncharacterized protein LOC116775597 [Danaus plexippus plexippus]